ncbi:hypothetical protein JAAARDRAFT_51907 [Jaapia argillacea MUCL 33604]|uniref:Uncharacterized protein n=1 Tax=Jaapia argillacea MUCL 33604 TaxID=933084 RepID=A0A067P290_9AGAM|nr:hypothetical protein JAAARDRAFT_51907 [Jaapia argillacea MUCL 33604]
MSSLSVVALLSLKPTSLTGDAAVPRASDGRRPRFDDRSPPTSPAGPSMGQLIHEDVSEDESVEGGENGTQEPVEDMIQSLKEQLMVLSSDNALLASMASRLRNENAHLHQQVNDLQDEVRGGKAQRLEEDLVKMTVLMRKKAVDCHDLRHQVKLLNLTIIELRATINTLVTPALA